MTVAQPVEHSAFNSGVVGSKPAGHTTGELDTLSGFHFSLPYFSQPLFGDVVFSLIFSASPNASA